MPLRRGQASGGVTIEKAIETKSNPVISAKMRNQMNRIAFLFKNRQPQALKIRLGRSAATPNICSKKSAK
jgi:hypothetical protein